MAETLGERHLAFFTPGTSDAAVSLLGSTTVPANHRYTISTIVLNNVTGSPATVTLARNATAATAANQWVGPVSVPANTALTILGPFFLEAGDSLHAIQVTSAAVNVDINGADHALS